MSDATATISEPVSFNSNVIMMVGNIDGMPVSFDVFPAGLTLGLYASGSNNADILYKEFDDLLAQAIRDQSDGSDTTVQLSWLQAGMLMASLGVSY